AMVVAVAAPQFVRSYNGYLLTEAARTFATTSLLGRVQAVTQQKAAVLHVDLDRQMFWLTQPLKNQDGEATEDQTLKVCELSKRVALVSAERLDAPARQEKLVEISFYPNGTCDPAMVVFRGERGALTATLDPITCQL